MNLTTLIFLLVVIALIPPLVWATIGRAPTAPPPPARPEELEGTRRHAIAALRVLEPGDTLHHLDHEWVVLGRLAFEEVGVRWVEHLLVEEPRTWLTIEDGHVFEVSLWRGVPTGSTEGEPGADLVVRGGTTYRLQEHGDATYAASGSTGTPASGSCRYSDYRSVDRQLLGFENYGDRWQTATGRLLAPEALRVVPRRR